jgi:hypothetical protein
MYRCVQQLHRNAYQECDEQFKLWCIISLRVEVRLFVLSLEIEDRNAVEVDNWAVLV